jgi:hypothetical protein
MTKAERTAISFVDRPAIDSNFIKFSVNKKNISFKCKDEEKRIVEGYFMVSGF